VGAAAACIAMPSAAQAATLSPAKVIVHFHSICSKVSPSAVRNIVGGFKVSAPTQYTSTNVIDKVLNISGTATSCAFTVQSTAAKFSPSKTVYLDSEVFNKSVTVATLEAAEVAQQKALAGRERANNFKVSWSNYPGLGVTAVLYQITASFGLPTGFTLPKGVTLPKGITLPKVTGFAITGIATLSSGTQSYAASINNDTTPSSELASLVKLAMGL
jgi:hypothetical protein